MLSVLRLLFLLKFAQFRLRPARNDCSSPNARTHCRPLNSTWLSWLLFHQLFTTTSLPHLHNQDSVPSPILRPHNRFHPSLGPSLLFALPPAPPVVPVVPQVSIQRAPCLIGEKSEAKLSRRMSSRLFLRLHLHCLIGLAGVPPRPFNRDTVTILVDASISLSVFPPRSLRPILLPFQRISSFLVTNTLPPPPPPASLALSRKGLRPTQHFPLTCPFCAIPAVFLSPHGHQPCGKARSVDQSAYSPS